MDGQKPNEALLARLALRSSRSTENQGKGGRVRDHNSRGETGKGGGEVFRSMKAPPPKERNREKTAVCQSNRGGLDLLRFVSIDESAWKRPQ